MNTPEPPRPRKKIPGSGNLYVCGDGKVYRWDKSGWHDLKPFCKQGEDLMYAIKIRGEEVHLTLGEMIALAAEGEKQQGVQTKDAKAYRAIAEFILANYQPGPISLRAAKRVANQLVNMAEEAERRETPRVHASAMRVR